MAITSSPAVYIREDQLMRDRRSTTELGQTVE
ncbi:hypothetical protein ACHAXS_002987 [Conticribra weissflogii]